MKGLLLLISSLFVISNCNVFGQKDSLLEAIGYYEAYDNPTMDDTSFVYQLNEIIGQEVYSSPKLAHVHAYAVYDLSKKLNYKKGIVDGLHRIADAKMHWDQIDAGMDFADKTIAYAEANGLTEGLMNGYSSKGNGYYYKGQYDLAAEMYFKQAELCEAYFPNQLAGVYGAIGNVFRASGQNEKSEEYLGKGLKMARIQKDSSDLVFLLNNLGIVYKNLDQLEQSLVYYEEGLEIAKLTGNLRREGEFVYNMANVCFRMGDKEKGFKLMDRSAEITSILGTKRDMALENYNIGYWHQQFENYNKSIRHSLLAVEYAEQSNFVEVLQASSQILAECYGKLKDYKNAYHYGLKSKFYDDSLKKMTDQSAMLDIENQYEKEKIALKDSLQKEKDQLEFDHQQKLNREKVKSRENLLYIAGGVILLVIVGLVQLFRTNRKVQQKNQVITERNSVITKQKEEIEEVHKEITDSINYAQRIQSALISGNEEWDKISTDHYIFFKPKDVVSGDFYWAHHSEEENVSIWVTADCTGHGVPGAFMSMLGIGFLNEIVVENGNRNGGEILDQLRTKIIKALAQKGGALQKDGMDLALCIWDKNKNTLEFTGANNPLWVIRKTEDVDLEKYERNLSHETNGYTLLELRANKMPVGFQSDTQESFESKVFELKKEDLLVSFTDGYADQFGGERGKKLKYKPFKEILLDIHTKPVKLHANILETKFYEWKGQLEQIDDVCVIGVRV